MTTTGDRIALDGGQRFPAPAKLNLFLHVVGRRADGYHLIQSAMQLIDLADTVTIAARDDGVIARGVDLPGIDEANDLTIRAARLLQSASGTRRGATIAVDKRIPQGGGLGGGSSDAATTLLALNRLWHLDWPRTQLMDLGLSLGADVPFFIGGGAAFVEGIGERLTPITLPATHFALIHPGVAVPTATIFTAPELTRNTKAIRILDFSEFVAGASLGSSTASNRSPDGVPGDAVGPWRNDLEAVAVARHPAVGAALDWLSAREPRPGAGPARMSGSGACVFRPFDGPERAAAAVTALPFGWSGWSVGSVALHPLADYVRD